MHVLKTNPCLDVCAVLCRFCLIYLVSVCMRNVLMWVYLHLCVACTGALVVAQHLAISVFKLTVYSAFEVCFGTWLVSCCVGVTVYVDEEVRCCP